uniref:Uncharacterized protein n=1 Tax=Tetraselmis chuii TaxID=63592 RepID=A0A7S1T5X2_9CHLO|mmetsp:Transcript_6358/g.11473  ORF Transcript_6358/g.11473 Transcript_6358/m.11473 type:complete len:367 (+) Transcript_6358:87-1187(+)
MASRIRSGSGGLDSAATKVARREGDVDAATAANGSEGRKARRPRSVTPVAVLTYKEGQALEVVKYYDPSAPTVVKVVVPCEVLSSSNRQVRGRQLWGSDVYTYDSDLVAILMHMGFYSHVLSAPPPGVVDAAVELSLLPPLPAYPSKSRNCVRSRSWYGSPEGCAIRVDACWLNTKGGGVVDLAPALEGVPGIAPTFMPAALERVMHTRSSASSVERRQRMKQEVTVQYNLCNEPWLKYSMAAVADQGLQPSQWTSARMHREVLYLETNTLRYELSRLPPTGNGEGDAVEEDRYRWAKCKSPMSLVRLKKAGVPLPDQHLEVIEPSLVWEDFQWSPSGLLVKGVHYPLVRLHFLQVTDPGDSAAKQ